MLSQLWEQWEICWTTWWNRDESQKISKIDFILTNFVPRNIMVIFQKLKKLLQLRSWSSYALLFRAHTLYICLIFETLKGIFRFKVANMFFGAIMFNVMSETSFISSGIRRHTMGWLASLSLKTWLCISEITLNFYVSSTLRYPRNLNKHSYFLDPCHLISNF